MMEMQEVGNPTYPAVANQGARSIKILRLY
jgi:hypothetical protein